VIATVVVTGTSTGIGYSTARVLTQRGVRVFGSVRHEADGDRVGRELGSLFTPLVFDITDSGSVHRAADAVAAALQGRTLSGLVNNAGIAVPGPLLHVSIEDFRRQIEVNLTGHLVVTRAFAPLLGTDLDRQGPPGRIVMMSSVGGRNAAPFVGSYSASKFALEGLSESLRRELMIYGIDVIVIGPGDVATPMWGKARRTDFRPFADTPYAAPLLVMKEIAVESERRGLPPDRIAHAVLSALISPRPKTRYSIAPNPMTVFLVNHLPKRFVDYLIAKRLGLTRLRK
jgi:NAD(P)-dependent dehydrogenase (short-subunit alcohol dehydrogenase family)